MTRISVICIVLSICSFASAQLPDLVVSDIEVISRGPTIVSYEFTIKNIGDGIADIEQDPLYTTDNISFQNYLSVDDILGNGDDIPAGGANIQFSPADPILPGQERTISWASQSTFLSQCNYLYIVLDQFNALEESNENNNVGMICLHGPDLAVTSLEVVNFNDTLIWYDWTVTNVGDEPAILKTDRPGSPGEYIYVVVQGVISADETYAENGGKPAGGISIGLPPQGPLMPGESISLEFSAGAQMDLNAYPYLVAWADITHVITDDANQYNNIAAAPIVPPVDLNGDEFVDLIDFAILSNIWPIVPQADLNEDQLVNVLDFVYFAKYWLRGRIGN